MPSRRLNALAITDPMLVSPWLAGDVLGRRITAMPYYTGFGWVSVLSCAHKITMLVAPPNGTDYSTYSQACELCVTEVPLVPTYCRACGAPVVWYEIGRPESFGLDGISHSFKCRGGGWRR